MKTISDKILKDRAHQISRNLRYHSYQRALESMVYKSFDKKTGSRAWLNAQLADELHKPVTKNSKEEKSMRDFRKKYLGRKFS